MTMKNRKGFVFPSVVFSVAVMSIIVVAAVSNATDERRTSRAIRESTLAAYAAESGLRRTYGAWPSTQVKLLNAGDSLDLGWRALPNNVSYRAVIHRLDKGSSLQQYNVVVQGRRTGINGGVATIVGVVGGLPLMTYAVFTQTNMTFAGGATVDSYDSEVAPYVAALADSNAVVWANGNIDIARTILQGELNAAGSITTGTLVTVTGDVTPTAPPAPAMDIISCPATGFTPAAQVPNGAGISYNAGTGILTVAAGATLNLTGSSYYFSRVILQGNSTLAVNPPAGSRTEIVVSDSVNVTGGTVANLSGAPTRLGFSSCGSPVPAKPWLFAGGLQAAYSVYAPNHSVVLAGGGSLYGAVIAGSYSMTGGTVLHYDEALARLPSEKLIVQRATWSMLPGN